jgi:hypothetical protein
LNAVTPAGAVYVDARQEYAIAKWRVSNIKTVGSGACIGCGTPATIEFRSANICAEGGLCYQHTLPAAALSNVITWQTPPTPTRSVTWGAVKSLYH